MKSFFSAAYCILMYAFLATFGFCLSRQSLIIFRGGRHLDRHHFVFFAVSPFLSFACQNKCQSNRGDRRILSSHGRSFFYRSIMLTEKRRISDDARQLCLKKEADEAYVYFILIIPISQLGL
ncbi:hypothetical protein [Bacillus paralicheniformis]|uniref:hypothetical protein n=2 Tax=Bacillaceae TaxID=186817 RepID=UPI002242E710|nr:hypothetical protein [Bacillus paralicheniformis]MEC1022590.1 hypothetical protein [Bacillus paralicheniformis]MEC1033876.1 hypothetical protein [Bacillus paralicheniformis]MEC1049631.1 hypothetical protein [Bacillus paralicheniformis]MEC1058822.1 hypothetical protein [Bacillus paralicheniformis]MEC1064130.1 hypothetical protein [Bacillus paralicheniformis]